MAAVVGHGVARAAAPRGSRPGAPRPGGRTATSTRSARCSTRPPAPRSSRTTSACASSSRRSTAQQIPGDTLAERGVARRGGAPADRAPVQGPGVGAGRGRPRAGGAAGPTCAGGPRCCARTGSAATGCSRRPHPRAARRGAPPVLRRLHPGPAAAGRHRRRVAPRTRASSRPGSSPSWGSRSSTAAAARRPLSLAGLVAELRRTVADPDTARAAGGRRRPAGRRWPRARRRPPARPQADPARGGARGGSPPPPSPVREAEPPVPMSASTLSALLECPTHWFLEREAGGATRRPPSQDSAGRARPRRAGRHR